jgi:hypothetical protein
LNDPLRDDYDRCPLDTGPFLKYGFAVGIHDDHDPAMAKTHLPPAAEGDRGEVTLAVRRRTSALR